MSGLLTDEELAKHRSVRNGWGMRIGFARGNVAWGPISRAGLPNLFIAYSHALAGYEEAVAAHPGRCTALSNAIRSLHAAMSALWFEIDGDAP